MGLVNIAKNSKVTFSSMSQWSTDEDCREIVTAEHNRDYSFHTNFEKNPWVELDLGAIYVLHNIVVFNRKNDFQDKAYSLQVAISNDKKNYEIIHKGFLAFKEKIEFNLDSLKTARYIKLSIDGFNHFHLSKIEVFIDESKNLGLVFDKPTLANKIKFNAFYIGSCRYMDLFPKHFPARLHTTKEIINFLNNYNKIDPNIDDVNCIWGDLLHPICKEKSIAYCNNMNHIFDTVKTVFLEITSRKYILDNGIIYSDYFYNFYHRNNDKTPNIIDDDELYSDLLHIKYLLKNLFGVESIVIIPHIDLLLDTGEKIPARDDLKYSLEKICEDLKFEFLDMNKAFPEGSYFKDYAPDSKHYSDKGYSVILPYLRNYLNSFLAENFAIEDCINYDNCTISNHEDIWTVREGSFNREDKYSIGKAVNNASEIALPCSTGVKISFDYNQHNLGSANFNNWVFTAADSSYDWIIGFGLSSAINYPQEDTWYHIEIEITSNSIEVTGDKTSTVNVDLTKMQYFKITNLNGHREFYIKNFKMLPL